MTLPTNKASEMADEREYFINLLMRGGVYKKGGLFKSWGTYTFTDHDTMRLVEFLMALRTPAPPVTREAVLEEAWQPINTAPRGKKHVALLLVRSDGSVTYGHGWYMPLEGWRCWDADPYASPTHWFPLPDPFAQGIAGATIRALKSEPVVDQEGEAAK